MEVRIIRSPRRRKTVAARLEGDIIVVRAPARLPEKELARMIEKLKSQIERRLAGRRQAWGEDLRKVFDRLNRKYFGGRLAVGSIAYSTVQKRRFGSCSPAAGTIRVSHHLASMPPWVRDYVVVHEMAHLLEPGHGRAFWELVNRYPLAERARGFLMAKSLAEDEGAHPDGGQVDLFSGDAGTC